MNRMCSIACIVSVVIWSTHDTEPQRLAIVEILWHGSEASVACAHTLPIALSLTYVTRTPLPPGHGNASMGEFSDVTAPSYAQRSWFQVAALKRRGSIQVSYDTTAFSGFATRPVREPARLENSIISKDWAYFVSRREAKGLAVYFKLFREGASPKDSAACVRKWKKLGQYSSAVR